MVDEYSLMDKAKTAIGYTLAGVAFAGFCYLYGSAMTEGKENCRFITMNPAILVCDDKKTAPDQRVLPSSKSIDEVVTE